MEDEIPDLIPIISKPSQNNAPEKNTNKIPLTIVTGYLGSGKTTLMTNLLTQKHGYKIAVVLNEFGDSMDMERQTLLHQIATNATESQDTSQPFLQEWLELRNGCLCCSVKDAGVKAIENLLEKKSRFDYVLLETTGLADPYPILNMFWLDEELQSRLQLDGVLTVVDGFYAQKYQEEDEWQRQVTAADVLIINKMDLLKESDELESKLQSMNGFAKIYKAEYCQMPISQLFNLKAYDLNNQSLTNMTSINTSKHVTKMDTMTFQAPKNWTKEKFEVWLQDILWEKKIPYLEIVRLKALIQDFETKEIFMFQAVCETFDSRKIDLTTESNIVLNNVVTIGKNLSLLSFDKI